MRGLRNVVLLLGLILIRWWVSYLLDLLLAAAFDPAFHHASAIAVQIAVAAAPIIAAAVAGAGGVAFDSPRKLRWVSALAVVLAMISLSGWVLSWRLYGELSTALQIGTLLQVALTIVGVYAGFAASRALTRGWRVRDITTTVDG